MAGQGFNDAEEFIRSMRARISPPFARFLREFDPDTFVLCDESIYGSEYF